jgi:lysyl oxidase
MRFAPLVVALATLSVVTCTAADRSGVVAPSGPQFAHVQDLDGTPDLIIDAKTLATSWVVYDHTLKDGACSLREEHLEPGEYRLLRFTVGTPNIGTGDLYIGDPNRHWDPNHDGDGSDSDGLFENNSCHGHFHFRNYALYQLIDANGKITKARKNGFCMLDIKPYNDGVSPKSWVYRACGHPALAGFPNSEIPGNQGVSVGYSDEYDKWLDGQFFVLDDPNADPVPPGDYTLRIWVNPPFTPTLGAPCPAKDPQGLCHNFKELNYDNNIGEISITIPDHPGKTGVGPGADKNPPDDGLIDDENRPSK